MCFLTKQYKLEISSVGEEVIKDFVLKWKRHNNPVGHPITSYNRS